MPDERQFSTIPRLRRPPIPITNKGLEVHIPAALPERESLLLPLNCQCFYGNKELAFAIVLKYLASRDEWYRVKPLPSGEDETLTVG